MLFVCLIVLYLRLFFRRVKAIKPSVDVPAIRAIARLAHGGKVFAVLGACLVAQCSKAGGVDNEAALCFWIRTLAITEASAIIAATTNTLR